MTQMPQAGSDFGRYHIEDQVGVGGMGVVFRATDTQLRRVLALKVVSAQYAQSEQFQRRFAREAETMARVQSPNIVQIFDFGTYDGCPYLATQFIGGGDLAHLLVDGPLTAEQATRVCAQLAGALDAAHRVGVVHRDVKPSNVLLWERTRPTDDLHVFLCDFGIAQPDDSQAFTQTGGGITGSWGYLAPERLDGHKATPASDIYALGCVLWACLTGQQPYTGTDAQVIRAHADAEIPQLAGADPLTVRINEILRRTMAKHPAERYASAAEVRDVLATAGRVEGGSAAGVIAVPRPQQAPGQPVRASTTGVQPPAPRRKPDPRVLAGGAGLLCLALIVGVVIWLTTRGGGDDHKPAADNARIAEGVSGDVNNDGKPDPTFAVAGGSSTPRVTVMSTSSGYGAQTVHTWSGSAKSLINADANADGKTDLISLGESSGDNVTIRWVGHVVGRDYTTELPMSGASQITDVEPGDFNGDGHLDLALLPETGDGAYVSLGKGHGGWSPPTRWLTSSAVKNASFASGDFDGDGKTDLVRLLPTSLSTTRVELLASDGKEFKSARSAQSLRVSLRSVPLVDRTDTVGDVDGDGKLDLVFVSQSASATGSTSQAVDKTSWSTSGGFTTPTRLFHASTGTSPGTNASSYDFDLSDVDGDGKEDLVSAHLSGGRTVTVNWQQSTGSTLLSPKPLVTYGVPSAGATNVLLATTFDQRKR